MRLNVSSLLSCLLAASVLVWLAVPHALAHEEHGRKKEKDQERALRAVQSGEALPLIQILSRLQQQIDGDIVATEIEEEHGALVYEIKYIDRSGRLLEVEVDARTGEVIEVEEED